MIEELFFQYTRWLETGFENRSLGAEWERVRGSGPRVSYGGGSRMVGSRKGFAQQETDILNRMCKHSIWRSKCACRGTRTRMPRKARGKGLWNIEQGTFTLGPGSMKPSIRN